MPSPIRALRLTAAASVAAVVLVAACRRNTLVECGHDGPALPSSLIDAIKAVPEFHDCQRFIVEEHGALRYDSVFAIYASSTLGGVEGALGAPIEEPAAAAPPPGVPATGVTAVAPNPPAQGRSVDSSRVPITVALARNHRIAAVALIVAGGAYDRLGITAGLNCLYVGRYVVPGSGGPPVWFARMVNQVPDSAAGCGADSLSQVDPSRTRPLKVLRSTFADFPRPADYPDVARWDWDQGKQQQYIGIRCGAGWCEVGAEDFVPSPPLPVAVDAPLAERRVRLIKGWYDQQYLAKSVGKKLVPSGVLGTIIADTALGDRTADDFRAGYVPVARVILETPGAPDPEALAMYESKYNFIKSAPMTPDGARELLISGDIASPKWNARIPSPEAGGPDGSGAGAGPLNHRQKDITFREVSSAFKGGPYKVPAVARWRWLKTDEGTWTRCTEGCCELSK